VNRPPRLVNEVQQSYSFSRRAIVLGAAQGAVAVALASRMTWLAVIENQRYQLLAESNTSATSCWRKATASI